jgi:hypothetical protein
VHTLCPDMSCESGWRVSAELSGHSSCSKLDDTHLHGSAPLAEGSIKGKRVDCHVFDPSGASAADFMLVDAFIPSYMYSFE